MASLVIGLLGLKQSGKDTFAERLVSEHGFTRIAFADPLKAAALDINPTIRIEADEVGPLGVDGYLPPYRSLKYLIAIVGWEKAKAVRDVRRFLQNLGVAVRDNVDRDAWLNAARAQVRTISGPAVITDVRFPNEVEYVELVGTTIRIVRPGQGATDTHASETALADVEVDFTIHNDGTVAYLHAQADRMVGIIKP